MEQYGTLPGGKRIKILRFGIKWNHMEPYGTIWNPSKRQIDAKKIKLLRLGTIWNHMEPFLELKRSKKNLVTQIWNHMEPYGTIWNPS